MIHVIELNEYDKKEQFMRNFRLFKILHDKHFWNKLVSDPKDWESVRKLMNKALKEGVTESYCTVWKKVLKYKGETIEVT